LCYNTSVRITMPGAGMAIIDQAAVSAVFVISSGKGVVKAQMPFNIAR
jgi:hypothetical protein